LKKDQTAPPSTARLEKLQWANKKRSNPPSEERTPRHRSQERRRVGATVSDAGTSLNNLMGVVQNRY
jgi:hypothetical protein